MSEVSQFWAGTEIGDALRAPYSADEFSELFYWLTDIGLYTINLTGGTQVFLNGGVIFRTDESGAARANLAVSWTSAPGHTVGVESGLAIVDGKLYENTATVNKTYAVPVAGTNYYLMALQALNSAQTVRVALVGPVTVASDVLALQTTSHNDDFMMPLAVVEVDAANNVTLRDCRRMIRPFAQNIPYSGGRQGGSATDWSTYGSNNYEFGDEAGIILGNINQPAIALTEMYSTFYTWNPVAGQAGGFINHQPISIYSVEGISPDIVVKETTAGNASMCQSQMYNGANLVAHKINALFIGELYDYLVYDPTSFYYALREKDF